ncbi:MAG: glycosyltransferase [Polyangia bacterium]
MLVVDDGSGDDTGDKANPAGATVLRHPQNRGKGAAIQTSGFAYAQKLGASALLTMDADGQHDTAELENLLAAHKKQPDALIIGVRSFDPQVMPRRAGLAIGSRRIGYRCSPSVGTTIPSRASASIRSGSFRCHCAPVASIPRRKSCCGAAKLHIPLVEIPIATIYHGEHRSHFHNWEDTLQVIRLVICSPLWRVDQRGGRDAPRNDGSPVSMYETVSRDLAQSAVGKRGGAWRRVVRVLCATACVAMLSQSGCDNSNKPIIIKGPSVQPVQDIRWGTMRAVHRVGIDAAKGDGREQVTVRGMIAVERPDRFRLKAIGPGGITLFDLIKVGGDVKVVTSMAGADSSLQQKVLLSIGADLSAMFDLEPLHPSHKKYVDLKVGETARRRKQAHDPLPAVQGSAGSFSANPGGWKQPGAKLQSVD